MAPTNKETKTKGSPTKASSKSSPSKSSPTKSSPTKAGSTLATEGNVQLLWACLAAFLDDGQSINYQAVGNKMGIGRKAAYLRFYRLKIALEKSDLLVQTGQKQEEAKEEAMDMVKHESGEMTPVMEDSEEAYHVKEEPMEEDA